MSLVATLNRFADVGTTVLLVGLWLYLCGPRVRWGGVSRVLRGALAALAAVVVRLRPWT